MNKTEFINAVAEKSGLSKVDAKKAVEAFVETVSSELKERCTKWPFLGFGSFSVAENLHAKVLTRRLNNQSKSRHANQLNSKLAPN